jgi:hypothetical protein
MEMWVGVIALRLICFGCGAILLGFFRFQSV